MIITTIKTLSYKVFWPLIGIYTLYIIYKIIAYFYGLQYVVDKSFYNAMFVKQLAVVGGIMGIAFLLKYLGKQKLADLTLAIPAGITFVLFMLTILIWLFLAIVMILFSE